MAHLSRPLSPHLLHYRWPFTMILSALHRATGIALSAGTLMLAALLLALATGEAAYASMRAFCASWFGLFLLAGWSWSLCFHLCSGVRHLLWNVVSGFSKDATQAGNYWIIGVSTVLTASIWACVFAQGARP